MQKTKVLVYVSTLCLVAGLGGCDWGSDDDGKTGATGTLNAGEALTRAVSFAGGKLVDGLMPSATMDDVSLLPASGGEVEPGASSLMSFDMNPGDANTNSALVQFAGAKSHFEIDGDAFQDLDAGAMPDDAGGNVGAADAGSAADGGSDASVQAHSEALTRQGGVRRIALAYKLAKDACKELCDTVYEVEVTEGVRVDDKEISQHVTTTLSLDCRDTGDHDKCTDSGEPTPTTKHDAGDDKPVTRGDASTGEPNMSVDAGRDVGPDKDASVRLPPDSGVIKPEDASVPIEPDASTSLVCATTSVASDYDTTTVTDIKLDPKVQTTMQIVDALTVDDSTVAGGRAAHLYRIDVSAFPNSTLSINGTVGATGTRAGSFQLYSCDPSVKLDYTFDVYPQTPFLLSTVFDPGTPAIWLVVAGHDGSVSETANTVTIDISVDPPPVGL